MVYKDFALLGYLIFGDAVQVCEGLMQKSGYVLDLLEDLGIVTLLYEANQLLKNVLYVLELFLI